MRGRKKEEGTITKRVTFMSLADITNMLRDSSSSWQQRSWTQTLVVAMETIKSRTYVTLIYYKFENFFH